MDGSNWILYVFGRKGVKEVLPNPYKCSSAVAFVILVLGALGGMSENKTTFWFYCNQNLCHHHRKGQYLF